MIASALILHSAHRVTEIACALGFCLGVVMLAYGLRLRHRPLSQVDTQVPATPPRRSSLAEHRAVKTNPLQVIRLSEESPATRSVDMTQQQKIAAALMKAGISTAAWDPAEEPANGAEASVSAASTAAIATEDAEIHAAPANMPGSRHWASILLIYGGTVLAMVSLYLLLRAAALL